MHRWCAGYDRASIRFCSLNETSCSHVVSNHCAIHKYALACKTLPFELKSVLDYVVKTVNFIRGRAVNSRLFKAFCDDLGKKHQHFLFHIEVRWLSREKCSPVLQNLLLKLPCSFVSMGRWNLLHNLMTIDSN